MSSRSCYLRGCAHPECRAEHLRYCAERYARTVAARPGHNGLMPISPVQDHVRELLARGMSLPGIAQAADVPVLTLRRVLGKPPTARLQRRTSSRLLGVTAYQRPLGGMADATRTKTQLRALMRMGWPPGYLVASLGMTRADRISRVLRQRAVTARVAAAVDVLAESLGDTPGPCARTARRAERLGWPRPIDCDEDWQPLDSLSRARRVGRPPSVIAEDVAWLRAAGESDEQIAARLAVTVGALYRAEGREEISRSA